VPADVQVPELATTGSARRRQQARTGGMSDRAAALGGRLAVESPASAGTIVTATLPISCG
jgi:signal transduction histidine kinase